MKIKLNTSIAFHNKVNLDDKRANFGFSFYPAELKLTELVHHIRTGKAFTVGHFVGNSRTESQFLSSQLLALDLDKCDMNIEQLEESSQFIQNHAFMMYPTPSSTPEQPKTRILFVLNYAIEGQNAASRWRVLQLALMEYFHEVKPDEACKDPSRLFYGCETSDYYINYGARLPVRLVGNLSMPLAERDEFSRLAKHYTVTQRRADTDLERCANNFLNHGLNKVSGAIQGTRHDTFRNFAMWLYGLNLGGWPISRSDIERGLIAIATSWGDSESTIQNNLRWASEHCTATPIDEQKLTARGAHALLAQRQKLYGGQ